MGACVQIIAQTAGRYPALLALLAQLCAALLVGGSMALAVQLFSWRPSGLAAGLLLGLLAASFGRWFGLPSWWWWLNLGFVPALLLFSGAALPSWVFLVGFLLLLLCNWNSFGERVPLYLSGARSRQALAELLAQQQADFRFVDLGCGPAGALLWLARRFPQAQFVGVETAPLPFAVAWLRALSQRNCRIRYESLWRTDLAQFDVVYCFLSPAPMAELWVKASTQMAVGSLLVSNSFEVPGVPAGQQVELHDWRRSRLLIWRMPGAS
ncbi:class I SAM-dependent methyltransferase [Pseudomonas sp.]|uniref:class I SAM-dependent methyltransferase n=1 Tax=Pseudomonas sp. TaxID=306 RepID=UPI00273213C6|nr:class I SAM-dependent methyltransferase [Pseudomonas sp.]MDP2245899.1 class I SAM-dependent methyltransferase [Pseudomonas sp.]